MIQGTCRLWNISISAVVFLAIYNILLTVKLMYVPACPKRHFPIPKPKVIYRDCNTPDEKSPEGPINLNLGLGRWDNRHKYKLYDNTVVGTKFVVLNQLFKTCLATQSSLEKIASIIEVSNHWTGPISLATFAASMEELNSLLLYILYLRKCDKRIKQKVTFHLAVSKDRNITRYELDFDRLKELDCEDPIGTLQQLVKNIQRGPSKWRAKLPYPQNHLRNLARKNCQSKYVFLTDVDVVPSKGMAEEVDFFLEKTACKWRCAYVVPTYELDERVTFPTNKTELIRLANKGLARPFHQKVFIYNQFATNFSRWQSNDSDEVDVHISHPVTNFEFLYEPFYIAPDTVPPHDERFIGYGYTRNTQVYEMFVTGYDFLVLSPIFSCHWGLQVKKTRPPWREHQNNLNQKLFDGFKREIFARYNKDPLNMVSKKT